jgi:hypothetical protein
MITATLSSLHEYLYGTLSPSNMRWLAAHLTDFAERMEHPQKPYTMEELNVFDRWGWEAKCDTFWEKKNRQVIFSQLLADSWR